MAVDYKNSFRGAALAGAMLIPNANALALDTNDTMVIPSINGTTSMTAAVEKSNANVGRIYEGTREGYVGRLVNSYDLTDEEEKTTFKNKVNSLVHEAQVAQGAGKLRLDLNKNTGVVITDPNGISQSGFAVTNTAQEHVLRIYRGGSVANGPGDIGQKVAEYDLNDPTERKLAEDAIRLAQYEDNKHNADHDAHDAESDAAANVPPTARAQSPQAAVTQPLPAQAPLPQPKPLAAQDDELFKANVQPILERQKATVAPQKTPEKAAVAEKPVLQSATPAPRKGDEIVSSDWVNNEQAAIKAEQAQKPVVPPVQQSAAVEAANRERAKTQYADTGYTMTDAQRISPKTMSVTERERNPVGAALMDLEGSAGMHVFPHGYEKNGNYGSITFKKEADGIVSAYLGTGNIRQQSPLGTYDVNNPSSMNDLRNDLGKYAQNDSRYESEQYNQRMNSQRVTDQYNDRATYGGYYSRQQQPYGGYVPPDRYGDEYRGRYQGNGMYVQPPQGNYYGGGYYNQRMNDPNYQQQQYWRNESMRQNHEDRQFYRGINQARQIDQYNQVFERRGTQQSEEGLNRLKRGGYELENAQKQLERGNVFGAATSALSGGLTAIFGAQQAVPIMNRGMNPTPNRPVYGEPMPIPPPQLPNTGYYQQQNPPQGYPSMYPPTNGGGGWGFR